MAKRKGAGDESAAGRFLWEPGDIQFVTPGPKYAHIVVPIAGEDGNAFAILGRVQRAMKTAGLPPEEIAAFMAEATTGTYDALLQTVMRWVTAE